MPDGFALLHADSLFTLRQKAPHLSTAAAGIVTAVESPNTDRAISSKEHQGGEDAVKGTKRGGKKRGGDRSSRSSSSVGAAKKIIHQKDGKKGGKKEKNKKGKKAKTQVSLSD